MKSLLVCLLLVAVAVATREQFNAFKAKYSRNYVSVDENERRFAIFESNLKLAQEKTSRSPKAKFGVTKFSDLTPAEFKNTYLMKNATLGKLKDKRNAPVAPKVTLPGQLPSSFDWRNKGNVVTPVKDQGQCGSCWDFSATETMESVWALAGNQLVSLSEQQILDCDTVDGGCNGGDTTTAYQYVIQAGGLEPDADYEYTAEGGTCDFISGDIVAKFSSWNYVTQSGDENQMQSFCYKNSPLSVCVDAETWQSYTGGVITPDDDCGDSLDHCVQITGWSNQDGVALPCSYVQIGSDVCGIADEVTVPVAA
jgi:cathepsin F